jgi:O-antigen/teichoic acid export membrane protein
MVIALLLLGILAYATNQITGYSINLTKRTRAVVPVSVLAAAANLGLNLWLVPRWGILAAAFSTLLAFAGRAVALVFITRHSILPRIDFVVLIKIVVASACMYLALRAIPLDSTPWIAAAIGTGVGVYAVFALILGVIGRGEARLLVSSLRQIRGESFAPKEKP